MATRSEDLWNRELIPTDRRETGPESIDLEEAWNLALQQRPELESLRLGLPATPWKPSVSAWGRELRGVTIPQNHGGLFRLRQRHWN